ncbi:MAG: transglutaminase domain-containing protein [Bacteriovorax sp.]|jgi:hypothetical protein
MKQLLLPLLLISQLICTPAYSETGGGTSANISSFLDGAKKRIAVAIEKAQVEKEKEDARERERQKEESARLGLETERQKEQEATKISNSLLQVSGTVSAETKFVMARIAKAGQEKEEEVVIIPVKNGQYSELLAFRNGAGLYKVDYFSTNSLDIYKVSFTFLKSSQVKNLDTRNMDSLLPSQMVQSNNAGIAALAKEIIKDAVNEADAIKQIHDYITANVTYDYVAVKDDTYKTMPVDAMTVFGKKHTICSGYSNFLAALARSVNIRTRIIFGIAVMPEGRIDHAWNEVLVDNQWKPIDSTWDVEYSYKYFLATSEEFGIDHLAPKIMKEY